MHGTGSFCALTMVALLAWEPSRNSPTYHVVEPDYSWSPQMMWSSNNNNVMELVFWHPNKKKGARTV
jgi:hypothetical protein